MKQRLPQMGQVVELLINILKVSRLDGRAQINVHLRTNSDWFSVKKGKEMIHILETSITTGVSNMKAKLVSLLHDYLTNLFIGRCGVHR